MVICGAGDGAVRSYKSNTGDMLWVANVHTEKVTCLVVSEMWELVVSASSDGSLAGTSIKGGVLVWATQVCLHVPCTLPISYLAVLGRPPRPRSRGPGQAFASVGVCPLHLGQVFSARDAISCMAAAEDLWIVYVAGESGVVVAYNTRGGGGH